MDDTWLRGRPGVLELPSGRLVRGRGLRGGEPAGELPDFGVYLLGKPPPHVAWDAKWVRWPDFWVPADKRDARAALHEAWRRAASQRVELACGHGVGRTGAALACIAILDGIPPGEAVAFVRKHYHSRSAETPWQRRYVRTFS